MTKSRLFFLTVTVLLLALVSTSCRSEFERVRTSGDPEALLKAADNYFELEEYQKAQTLYELLIAPYRGRQEAEQIAFRYAYTYYYLEQYILASYYFKNFANTYGGSNLKEEADFMSSYSNYELSPIFRLDQTYSQKAIEGFEEFANQYPNSERVPRANGLIDEMRAKLELKDFESAKLYVDLRRYQSAIQAFDNLLKDYPETNRAEQIRYLTALAAYQLASSSFVEYQTDRYREALKYMDIYLKRYPNEPKSDELRRYYILSNKRLTELQDERYQNPGAGPRS